LSTALVALAPTGRKTSAANASARPRADFLAQLIATASKVPQARTRRRAQPQEATAAYAVPGQWPTWQGNTVARSI